MQFFCNSFEALIDNVAADEVLLDWAESEDRGPFIRLWESSIYGVVVGYGNAISREVSVATCSEEQIPIVRRCSGGGTVVQGPGCLNYAVVLPISIDPVLNSIQGTTLWVMGRLQMLFQSLASQNQLRPDNPLVSGGPLTVTISGDSDLAVNGLKFSGNAQRRRKRYVLFHGTILYAFDLSKVSDLLPHPSREPRYRSRRTHSEFITNIGIDKSDLIESLFRFFNASGCQDPFPDHLVTEYVRSRYSTALWRDKF
ncbi:lipoate--protein ligase family protein [bacterium]|nr:lipoate--protein ligase family protein [bacterium]